MRHKTRITALVAPLALVPVLAALLLASVESAYAQDALGNGNALDGNLSTDGSANSVARQEDYRVRNLLVTDNVPGGRGFRGSVGYSAENDFRGSLGSDDFYTFRADSAFSAPSFINYGRTYEQLRFGRDLAALEFSRDFQGTTLRQVTAPGQPAPGELIDARTRLDRISRSTQGLGVYESEPAGDTVGYTYDKDGHLFVARASSLQGIELTPATSDAQQIGLTPYDMARVREQAQTQKRGTEVGKPFEPKFEGVLDPYRKTEESTTPPPKPDSLISGEKAGGRIENTSPDQRINSLEPSGRLEVGQNESYRDILKRVVQRYAGQDNVSLNIDPALVKEFQQEYNDLRSTLHGKIGVHQISHLPETTSDEQTQDNTDNAQPSTTDDGALAPLIPSGKTAPDEPELLNTTEIDRLAGTLRHGAHIDQLASGDDTRFNELVATAEQALRQGEYFLAERRFDRALRFSPGNPLATAGMGHAQIGSGLYLSAALTIRTMLANNPEMIDVRYDPALIPARSRLESALATARERINKKQDVALNSFLVAYIGRLLDDASLMREGLDSLAKALPGDALEKLLRAVWIPETRPIPANDPQK